jgi:hypothetical protein
LFLLGDNRRADDERRPTRRSADSDPMTFKVSGPSADTGWRQALDGISRGM